jgi:integrating conjugative element protein (TIGR03746 family)
MKLNLPKKLVGTLAEQKYHITSLRLTVFLQTLIMLGLIGALWKAPDNITVHVPPDVSNGVVMNINDVPKSYVLSSISYLWLEVNSWYTNGEEEAFDLLNSYEHYFSPRFKEQLHKSYTVLKGKGELDRVRKVSFVPGSIHEIDKRVFEEVKNKAWTVYLDVIVEDFYLGERVQYVTARFPIQVERVDMNYDQNPLGLIITGFERKPTIVKDMES